MTFESDPFRDLLRLQEQLGALLGAPAENRPYGGWSGGVYPPLNIFRSRDGIMLRAELPGVRPEDVDVTVEGRQVTLTGERRPPEAGGNAYHRRERTWGKFSRTIRLPDDLDVDGLAAQCRNGVLTVTVPVAAAAKPRHVAVRAA